MVVLIAELIFLGLGGLHLSGAPGRAVKVMDHFPRMHETRSLSRSCVEYDVGSAFGPLYFTRYSGESPRWSTSLSLIVPAPCHAAFTLVQGQTFIWTLPSPQQSLWSCTIGPKIMWTSPFLNYAKGMGTPCPVLVSPMQNLQGFLVSFHFPSYSVSLLYIIALVITDPVP